MSVSKPLLVYKAKTTLHNQMPKLQMLLKHCTKLWWKVWQIGMCKSNLRVQKVLEHFEINWEYNKLDFWALLSLLIWNFHWSFDAYIRMCFRKRSHSTLGWNVTFADLSMSPEINAFEVFSNKRLSCSKGWVWCFQLQCQGFDSGMHDLI